VQALGGGSPELPALATTRRRRAEAVEESEPVPIPIEDALDLHTFAPADIPAVVADYLEAAHARGFREVRLIHGRGRGVQREIVRSVLSRHPLVVDYADAPPERGGWGATIARIRAS
jgi:dsDNA-specific endonuclease/ATPase MutS2